MWGKVHFTKKQREVLEETLKECEKEGWLAPLSALVYVPYPQPKITKYEKKRAKAISDILDI